MSATAREDMPVAVDPDAEAAVVEEARPRVRPWRLVIWAVVLGLLAILAWRLVQANQSQPSSGLAPDFTLATFDGQSIRLSSLRGKVVVVNFWASWCKPCEDEAPALEKAYRAYKDRGVVFLGVDWVDTDPEAKAFLKKFDVTYPNGPDQQTMISHAYRTRGVPETFFIGRSGQIEWLKLAPLSYDEITTHLDQMTAEAGG